LNIKLKNKDSKNNDSVREFSLERIPSNAEVLASQLSLVLTAVVAPKPIIYKIHINIKEYHLFIKLLNMNGSRLQIDVNII
jgi:hypothetical protein